jgi:hypothetical protein
MDLKALLQENRPRKKIGIIMMATAPMSLVLML